MENNTKPAPLDEGDANADQDRRGQPRRSKKAVVEQDTRSADRRRAPGWKGLFTPIIRGKLLP